MEGFGCFLSLFPWISTSCGHHRVSINCCIDANLVLAALNTFKSGWLPIYFSHTQFPMHKNEATAFTSIQVTNFIHFWKIYGFLLRKHKISGKLWRELPQVWQKTLPTMMLYSLLLCSFSIHEEIPNAFLRIQYTTLSTIPLTCRKLGQWNEFYGKFSVWRSYVTIRA